MKHGEPAYHPEDLTARMTAAGVSPKVQSEIQEVVAFHTYPAPGALIGTFMVDWALELIGADRNEKLYAVAETPKCLPDAIQVLAGCTTGNHRLRVLSIGKFALSMNRASGDVSVEAVRVYVDTGKLKDFRIAYLWFMNSREFNKHAMTDTLMDEIFRAGRSILSCEKVRIAITPKQKWKPVSCPACGEAVPDYMIEGDHCAACGSMKYYERID